jgi:hypothetical protein
MHYIEAWPTGPITPPGCTRRGCGQVVAAANAGRCAQDRLAWGKFHISPKPVGAVRTVQSDLPVSVLLTTLRDPLFSKMVICSTPADGTNEGTGRQADTGYDRAQEELLRVPRRLQILENDGE